jgi:hypothetical protein
VSSANIVGSDKEFIYFNVLFKDAVNCIGDRGMNEGMSMEHW